MAALLYPKEITVSGKRFKISKFPAVEGREIIAKYPISLLPKVGDYKTSEETMLKIMARVAAISENGSEILLVTRELVDNHIPCWEDLVRIEYAMMEYNCSFLQAESLSGFWERFQKEAVPYAVQILNQYSNSLSAKNTQH